MHGTAVIQSEEIVVFNGCFSSNKENNLLHSTFCSKVALSMHGHGYFETSSSLLWRSDENRHGTMDGYPIFRRKSASLFTAAIPFCLNTIPSGRYFHSKPKMHIPIGCIPMTYRRRGSNRPFSSSLLVRTLLPSGCSGQCSGQSATPSWNHTLLDLVVGNHG